MRAFRLVRNVLSGLASARLAHAAVRSASLVAVAFIVTSGCSASGPVERLPSAGRAENTAADLREWDDKWRTLQGAPESVSLADHWRVCEIKFRFRNYGDLFLCLELIERRVAHLGEGTPQQRYAPVLVGWMRAGAYAELGQPAEAAKWVDAAWDTLPQEYHEVSGVVPGGYGIQYMLSHKEHDFAAVAIDAGGSEWVTKGSELLYPGLNNPAGIDMRPQTIAMNLAAERVVLHLQLNQPGPAKLALQDLDRWRDTSAFYFVATSLAIGPAFASGDYANVIKYYEDVAARVRLIKGLMIWSDISTLGLGYLQHQVFSISDSRQFAVALEDVSRELLYGTSLSRLGQTDRAKSVFDAMLATPEVRDMGSLYWTALYERSRIAMAEGRHAEAVQLLQRAADAIEQVRGTINFEAGKIGFAGNTQAVYATLVTELAAAEDWNGAFLAAERAKSRALVDLLAQVRDLPAPAQSDVKVRDLLAQASLDESRSGLAGVAGAAKGRGAAAARSELAKVAPEAASLVSVQVVPVGQVASRLDPEETLIDYFETDDALYAFAVRSDAAVTAGQSHFKTRPASGRGNVRPKRPA